ncbi:major facilitator superfamily [Scheffersomyces amazonensis]|uniref:major facilitator superfamily n=1 Tax=Scheffersomyces amazonensis TaxID=1078765 RepID=UPI00315DC849
MFGSITFKWVTQLVVLVSHIVGLFIFLRGFFPSKVVLPGFNGFYESRSPFGINDKPQFDKVIFMVVDAMRSDFCFSNTYSHMTFLHQLINDGSAIPYTAFSNPPTVTLPRLKGITTGGTPNFLDAILNVADDKDTSQGLNSQDSWVFQFKNLNKTVNFFGDDTWLKLFPGSFNEFEGTNSFFVSDFTEVDNNVTRHLDTQLDPNSAQWDALILHYLGLDHIGHKGGPDSVFMKPKLEEMDSILARIYDYTLIRKSEFKEDILIVFMGDHGMNDIGNHGASSPGETSAALTFISPKFSTNLNLNLSSPLDHDSDYTYYHRINQIDLVPTLAGLLNFPIPKNNLGIMVPELLKLWSNEKQQKAILWENCQQLMELFKAKYGDNDSDYASVWNSWNSLQTTVSSLDSYYDLLYEVQQILASSATNYDYNDIFMGFGIILVSTSAALVTFNQYFLSNKNIPKSLVVYFEIFAAIYALHFHGSSLIEEEHQIWFFFTIVSSVFMLGVSFKSFNKLSLLYWGIIFLGIRLLKAWNNSGQKYSYKNTIGAYLLNQDTDILWLLIIATYIIYSVCLFIQGGFSRSFEFLNPNPNQTSSMDVRQAGSLISFIAIFVTSSVGLSFKLCQFYNDGYGLPKWLKWVFFWILENYNVSHKSIDSADFKFALQSINTQLSRLSGYCILGLLAIRVSLGKVKKFNIGIITDISNIVTLYLIQQTKFENIPIFIVLLGIKYGFGQLIIQSQSKGTNIDQHILLTTIFTICIQNLTFFSMGNTNSLATVDLSNAYNGILEYDVIPVGVLTFISNFVGPIYWSLASLQLIFETSKVRFEQYGDSKDLINFKFLKTSILLIKTTISTLFYALAATNLLGSCINLRFHLFIWTVFSPKLLYFASWSVLVNFLVDLISASVILFVFY